MRSLAVVLLLALTASSALAAPRKFERVPVEIDPRSIGAVVNSKTIFLNRCVGGCKVYSGFTDSRMNKSGIGQGTLSAFEHGNTSWAGVVACMKDVFDRFNVTVTETDPGPNVDHFEIMVAGSPTQIGLSNGIAGIAEYSCTSPGVCSKYMPNALVFAFANVISSDPDEICGTVAQEIAHTWSLDHVAVASSPLSYYSYSGRQQFQDDAPCGSDCVNGYSPFDLPCSSDRHTCMSTGQATQDEVQTLMALFGPAGAVSPNLTIKSPTTGAAVGPAFMVEVECTSMRPIQEVQLSIDGVLKATLTAPPFTFVASNTLAEGPHKIGVLCATDQQAITTKTIDVILGSPCTGDSQCQTGYICFDSACIAGPSTAGGLGAACLDNVDCKAGACASDGEIMACTIPCDLSNKNCPDGFGCLEAGTTGVCWAGFDDGTGGCCDAGSDPRGPVLLTLGIAAVWITRRRPKKRR